MYCAWDVIRSQGSQRAGRTEPTRCRRDLSCVDPGAGLALRSIPIGAVYVSAQDRVDVAFYLDMFSRSGVTQVPAMPVWLYRSRRLPWDSAVQTQSSSFRSEAHVCSCSRAGRVLLWSLRPNMCWCVPSDTVGPHWSQWAYFGSRVTSWIASGAVISMFPSETRYP